MSELNSTIEIQERTEEGINELDDNKIESLLSEQRK